MTVYLQTPAAGEPATLHTYRPEPEDPPVDFADLPEQETSTGLGEDPFDLVDDIPDRTDDLTAPSIELFTHDQGTLTLDQRRTLVRLLEQRYLTPRSHPTEWQILVRNEDLFRSRLHDMMLDLRVDSERGVAFKSQIVLGETPTPRLLKDRGYTREETLILYFLRQRLYKDRGEGAEVVIVDEEEILDYVATYRPDSATDQARDRQITEKALQRMVEAGIVKKTADPTRLAIQQVLETLMPLETLRELARTLAATVERSEPDTEPDHVTQDEGDSHV